MTLLTHGQYILDTGFFVIARGYYPDTFPSFWKKMDSAVESSVFSSVQEVWDEINSYGGEQEYLVKWMSEHKYIFDAPNDSEQEKVTDIMNRFPDALTKRNQQEKRYWADPLVIARAQEVGGVVVSREKSIKTDKERENNLPASNPEKIPDICEVLEVRCITPQVFMKELGWKF